MKYCPGCRQTKSREDFHKNKARADGLRSYCKDCSTKKNRENPQWRQGWMKIRVEKFYKIVNEAKSVPCMDCGGVFPPCAMDFDHRDAEEKKFNIAQAASRTIDSLIEEIAKCDVVCANCHRIRTFVCTD